MREKSRRIESIKEHIREPDHVRDNPATGFMYETLAELASKQDVHTVIEIGSTDGRGSTMALREGLEKNPNYPNVQLFCIEPIREMFYTLVKTRAPYMECYRACATHPKLCYTDEEIKRFFAEDWPTGEYDIPEVKEKAEWHITQRDKYNTYFRENKLQLGGVRLIKRLNNVRRFDLALVDGGHYSGRADTQAVYGARYLVLDDIYTLKCLWVYRELENDPKYRMIMHQGIKHGHFGYAAFERIA